MAEQIGRGVSGAYTAGDVVYSLIDFFTYRAKTTGSLTTDPSLDSANWALLTKTGAGGSETTSGAVDITLLASASRLQVISMTAANKKVTLPNAILLEKGAPVFVFKNSGAYQFVVRDNAGSYLLTVNPKQVASLHCSDNTTTPGVWQVSGEKLQRVHADAATEVVNAVASTFISTAMLTSTKAICVYRGASNYLEAVVLNYGGSAGTPVVVNGEISVYPEVVALSATQAVVVYTDGSERTKGYVLDISGDTITPGVVASINALTGAAGVTVAVLSMTKLLCCYRDTSGTQLKMKVLDVASSVITPGSEATATVNTSSGGFLRSAAISASRVVLAWRRNSGAVNLTIETVSGSTATKDGGDLAAVTLETAVNAEFAILPLSGDRVVLCHGGSYNETKNYVSVFDVSGTTPLLLNQEYTGENNTTSYKHMSAGLIDDTTVLISWNQSSGVGVKCARVSVSANNVIQLLEEPEKSAFTHASSAGYANIVALDAKTAMQVYRGKDTFLNVRDLELGV